MFFFFFNGTATTEIYTFPTRRSSDLPKQPLAPVPTSRFFSVISESISESALVSYYRHQWQGWK